MKTQLSKNTLLGFFSGNASPLQKKLIEEWLKEDNNKELFYELMEEWERDHPQLLPNTELALDEYLIKIQGFSPQNDLSIKQDLRVEPKKMRWLAYAASVTFLLAVTLLLSNEFILNETHRTEYGEVRMLTLPDGSKVTLNSNSMLRISRFDFGTTSREVYLEGEAEFSVVHTKDDKKFFVHTPDQLEVEVLGTEFIVYSRNRGSKVVLNEGKVLLRSTNDTVKHQMVIKPGDVVTINKGVFNLKENQVVQVHAEWKDHRFVFDRTSLKDVAFEMEENFGVNIQIPDSLLAKRELTGTYEAENVDELLNVIKTVLDVRVSQRGKRIIMSAKQ